MKKIIFVIALSTAFISCKNSEEKAPAETTPAVETESVIDNEGRPNILYKGEFIYLTDGAVLKGENFIFGVKLNEKAFELSKMVAPIKKDEFDMVPVVVKGKMGRKPENEEGWEQVLTITEIVSVSDTPATPDVKIEAKKN